MASAKAFKKLLNKEYIMTVAKKNKSHQFKLVFSNTDFRHLSGIQKLIDLDIHELRANALFNYALTGRVTVEDLKESIHFDEMKERMENLKNLESYLDNNMVVYKWDKNVGKYSMINAEYILKENTPDNTPDDIKTYVFLREMNSLTPKKKVKVEEIKKESAISFFLEKIGKYEKHTFFTLLKNEKIDNAAKTRTVLYDFEEAKKAKATIGQAVATPKNNTAEKSPTVEDFTVTRNIGGTFTVTLGDVSRNYELLRGTEKEAEVANAIAKDFSCAFEVGEELFNQAVEQNVVEQEAGKSQDAPEPKELIKGEKETEISK